MRINTNINAMVATNQMSKNTALSGNSMEKLASGLRITKAGDDAAGLAISEKMRSQIRGMEQADRNVQDGVSLVQTAEGSMEEIGNITQRMRELTVQASSETNTLEDRTKITEELNQLNSEITRISESTTFNNEKILMGGGASLATTTGVGNIAEITNLKINSNLEGAKSIDISADANGKITLNVYSDDANTNLIGSQTIDLGSDNAKGVANFDKFGVSFEIDGSKANSINDVLTTPVKDVITQSGSGQKNIAIQAGANNETNNTVTVNIDSMTSAALGIEDADINDIAQSGTKGTEAAKAFIDTLDAALSKINTSRATLGAQQNRLEYASSNLTASTENLTAAESRIRDVDVAKEMVNLSKLNILSQASQSMVSQAKSQPENVLQLLQ